MSDERPQENAPHRRLADPWSCLWIGAGTLLMVVGMALHPSAHAHEFAESVARIAGIAELSRAVHGGMIALIVLVVHGFVGWSRSLGWHDGRVRAGLLAYATGAACLVLAALVNGFVVGDLAQEHAGGTAAELEALRPVLELCWDLNQALARVGTAAVSAALLCWSTVLLGHGRFLRGVGVLGWIVGSLSLLGVLSGHVRMHVHGFGAVVAAQALWSVCVAFGSLRARAPARPGP